MFVLALGRPATLRDVDRIRRQGWSRARVLRMLLESDENDRMVKQGPIELLHAALDPDIGIEVGHPGVAPFLAEHVSHSSHGLSAVDSSSTL